MKTEDKINNALLIISEAQMSVKNNEILKGELDLLGITEIELEKTKNILTEYLYMCENSDIIKGIEIDLNKKILPDITKLSTLIRINQKYNV